MRQLLAIQHVDSDAVVPSRSWFETSGSCEERVYLRVSRAVRQYLSNENYYRQNKRYRQLITPFECDLVVSAFCRLDIHYLIASSVVRKFCEFSVLLAKEARLDDRKLERPEWITRFLEIMVRSARAVRCSIARSRVQLEIFDAWKNGRYVFFETLTAMPGEEDVFAPRSQQWRDFQQSWKRALEGVGSQYHAYYSVPELGEKNGRLHYHVLRVVDRLPAGFADPALFDGSYRRKVDFPRRFWKYGHYEVIPVRWSDDAFSRLGWRWPLNSDGSPVESNMLALSNYLSKYITKRFRRHSVDKKNGFICKLRTKMSRSFGMTIPEEKVSQASSSSLAVLLEMPICRDLVKRIPHIFLLRRLARKWLVRRQSMIWNKGDPECVRSLRAIRLIPILKNDYLRILQEETFRSLSFGSLIIDPVPREQYDGAVKYWRALSRDWSRQLSFIGGRHEGAGFPTAS